MNPTTFTPFTFSINDSRRNSRYLMYSNPDTLFKFLGHPVSQDEQVSIATWWQIPAVEWRHRIWTFAFENAETRYLVLSAFANYAARAIMTRAASTYEDASIERMLVMYNQVIEQGSASDREHLRALFRKKEERYDYGVQRQAMSAAQLALKIQTQPPPDRIVLDSYYLYGQATMDSLREDYAARKFLCVQYGLPPANTPESST
jgi:hypothetical protein